MLLLLRIGQQQRCQPAIAVCLSLFPNGLASPLSLFLFSLPLSISVWHAELISSVNWVCSPERVCVCVYLQVEQSLFALLSTYRYANNRLLVIYLMYRIEKYVKISLVYRLFCQLYVFLMLHLSINRTFIDIGMRTSIHTNIPMFYQELSSSKLAISL